MTAQVSARNNAHRHAEAIVQIPFLDHPVTIDFIIGANPTVARTSICRLFADEVASAAFTPPAHRGPAAANDPMRFDLPSAAG